MNFAITITLKPYVRRWDPDRQVDESWCLIQKLFNAESLASTLVTELTASGDVHYHGVIRTATPISLLKLSMRLRNLTRTCRIIGFICLKNPPDLPGWISYVTKDVTNTMSLMVRNPILSDELDLLPVDLLFKAMTDYPVA